MPDVATLALFTAACAVLTATPGPDMLLIASRSMSQGRAAGFMTYVGIATGSYLQALAAAYGLSQLFLLVPAAYDALRWAGAAYLDSTEGDEPVDRGFKIWDWSRAGLHDVLGAAVLKRDAHWAGPRIHGPVGTGRQCGQVDGERVARRQAGTHQGKAPVRQIDLGQHRAAQGA